MTMHPSAQWANVKRNIMDYISDSLLGTGTGFPAPVGTQNLWWQGQVFDQRKVPFFVRVAIRPTQGERFAAGCDPLDPGASPPVNVKDWFVFIDVFAKPQLAENNPTVLEEMHDRIKELFSAEANGADRGIPIRNLTGGLPLEITGCLVVRGREPRIPIEESDWLMAGWTIELEAIEVDTTS